jgi:hypothetical protein
MSVDESVAQLKRSLIVIVAVVDAFDGAFWAKPVTVSAIVASRTMVKGRPLRDFELLFMFIVVVIFVMGSPLTS